jgi:hypothetical protein
MVRHGRVDNEVEAERGACRRRLCSGDWSGRYFLRASRHTKSCLLFDPILDRSGGRGREWLHAAIGLLYFFYRQSLRQRFRVRHGTACGHRRRCVQRLHYFRLCRGSYIVTSTVQYQIEVTGPTNTTVLYDFATAGNITATAPFPSGFGTAAVHVFVNQGNTLQVGTLMEQDGQTICYTGCINGTYQVSLATNTPYNIEVSASARAFTNYAETT